MCALWAWSATDALVHSVVVQHHFCDEHGAIEDGPVLGAATGDPAGHEAVSATPATARLASGQADEEHHSCGHFATIREQCSALVPPVVAVPPPPPPLIVTATPARHLEAFRPRGPPLYRTAPKNSPPRSA